MFKKLSHILTAFLFYHLSVVQHPVFFILFNINNTIPKFTFHFLLSLFFQNTIIFFSVVILMDPIVLI